jgi:arylsulfatase A-like enzyme
MFTGLYPRTHGATNLPPGLSYGEPLDAKFETLAEKLAALGYLNLGVVANYGYLRHDFGFHQGFHIYDARQQSVCFPGEKYHSLRFGLRRLLRLVMRIDSLEQLFRNASQVNESAFRLLQHAKETNAPFFLFVNYMDAHNPYIPPAPYNTLFGGPDPELAAGDWTALHDGVAAGKRRVTERERSHFVSQYDGAIAYLDSQIEELVKRLEQLGQFDNTMIIVTSDHGEAFGEHGHFGHGWSVHQSQVQVPLIIKYPGQKTGRVQEVNAGHVDLMPTVLDVVGSDIPRQLQGASLRSFDAGNEARSIYSEAYLGADKIVGSQLSCAHMAWAAVSPERRKLISASDGRLELYDLEQDPAETHDLRGERTEEARRLLEELEGWKQRYPLTAAVQRPRNRLTLERLRALGYVR